MLLLHARRLAGALCGAGVLGLLAALLDARWALGAAGDNAPSLGAMALIDAGLLAPVALGVGAAVGLAAALLHPLAPPSLTGLGRWLDAPTGRARGRRVNAAFAAPLLSVLWMVGAARIAVRLLSTPATPAAAGLAIALAVTLLGLGCWLVWAGLRELGARHALPLSPKQALVLGIVLGVAVLSAGIVTGNTGGTAGTLGIFGVLKRDELDLRAPFLLLLLAIAAYLAPALLAKRLPLAVLIVVGLAPLGLVFHAAGGLDDRKLELALSRGAPVGKLALSPLRKLGDGDGDGHSRLFGGGDCDDANAAIFPGAEDTPGNGVDEDCSGQDDIEVALEEPKKVAPKSVKEHIRAALPEKPNVLLISIDTLRYDLGYMGYERPVSPNLDKLAKRSTVFENAYSLASYTGKSIGPMLIGKHTSETHRGWSHFNKFGKQDTFVQERLQKAGIETLSVQAHWYFKADTGLGRGFDVLDVSSAPKVLMVESDRSVTSDKLSDVALKLLQERETSSKQFYMWVHYLDPHAEYVSHEKFDFGKKSRELYDGEVAFTDHHIGRLLDFVASSKLAQNTIIVVTSDHGEAFGEHGLIRHGFEVWEELVRVPLVVHVPGQKPRRVKARRGAVDVVPTILDVFAAPAPSDQGNDFLSGQSLLADVLGPPGHEVADRIVFVDMSAGPHNAERQAFIENDMKLIASEGRPLGLYDLKSDPEEKKDLLDDPEQKQKVLPRFKAFRRKLRTVKVKRR